MCGILGIVQQEEGSVKKDMLALLQRLEYRGYDSCGFATSDGITDKATGKISGFIKDIDDTGFRAAISHTRWATHGGVTTANSHPHFNAQKDIFVVHNGIIENSAELKSMLQTKGYEFVTETDTEVIPHYFDMKLRAGMTMHQAIKSFMKDIKGTYAALIMRKGKDEIYAIKKDSPLVLGICDGCNILASDIYAFNHRTDKAIFFEDFEYAKVTPKTCDFFDRDGKEISKTISHFDWQDEDASLEYPHYMLKEIHEQPSVSRRLLTGLETTQKGDMDRLAKMITEASRIVFVACGTSYHASLIGAHMLGMMGYRVHAIVASEFDTFYRVDDTTLIIAVSQSGETMDVVTVVKEAKAKGAKIASIVNVPYSTLQRQSDISLEIQAGQEIAVASTKAFTNQVILLLALAKRLGHDIDLSHISSNIAQTIKMNEDIAKRLAAELYQKKDIFIIGKGPSYPISREIALKLKEVSYVHAEGMMAGELKHGTIALIEKGTPVISLIPNRNADMLSATREVEARGARTIIISNTNGDLHTPESDDMDFSIYASIIGHLLSYYIGIMKGCEIDQPRNLAKSVTVR